MFQILIMRRKEDGERAKPTWEEQVQEMRLSEAPAAARTRRPPRDRRVERQVPNDELILFVIW